MILSVVGIVLEEIESGLIPINPTIIRVMRVMRIARGEHAACCLIVTWKQSFAVCDKNWKQTLHVAFGIHFRFFVDEVQPTGYHEIITGYNY